MIDKLKSCPTAKASTGITCLLVAVATTTGGTASASGTNWEAGVTTVIQDADDSRVDSELTASMDLAFTRTGSRGEWLLYIEASSAPDSDGVSAVYPTANADAGSVLNRDGDGGVQVSEFNYTFDLNDERRLMVGLVNPSAWLDRSNITNDENTHFINGSFKNNATIEFPDYTIGAIMRWPGSAAGPEITLVVASSDGIADLPDRSYQDLLNLSSDQRGAFLGAGARWLGEQTSLRLGAWLRSDDHEVAGSPNEFEMNYGIYAVAGWEFGDDAVSLRVGMANEAVSVATRFAAVAYERRTPIGLFGLGLARTRIANNFRQADLDDVTSAEVFLRLPIGLSGAQITPSIQHVENPGFDTSGATLGSSALVAGVRFHWSLAK